MATLPYSMERTLVIEADRDIVFRFFLDNDRWATWWGAGSTVDARAGGPLLIRHANGFESTGQVLEVSPPERFVFTFSLQAERVIPPEESRVTIRLEPHESGTMLRLTHELADAKVRDLMVQGWRFSLSLFANAIADEVHAGAGALVDAWLGLYSDPDETAREQTLQRIAANKVRFRDRFSCLEGIDEVGAHMSAAQRFMRLRMERRGEIRHCQGMVLANWAAMNSSGQESMSGISVFTLGTSGRIESVTGVTNPK
jgi:uncharacterized protein YndB with AHSA1/START domain